MTPGSLERRLAARASRQPLLRRLVESARNLDLPLWLVGGWVRDAALGRPAADFDLVASRGTARLVADWRNRFGTTGFRFRKRGVTTWRFRLDDAAVDLVDAARRGLEADLARRDLTVNAMAWDATTGRLADPCGGLADVRRKRLHPPRPSVFDEDPLRALRLARFAAWLDDFAPSRTAIAGARRVARRAAGTAVERRSAELDRLLAAPAAARGLRSLADWGLRQTLLPELEPLATCPAGGGRPDVWEHTVQTLEQTATLARRRVPGAARLRVTDDRRLLHWTLLLHDISKPETLRVLPDGRPTFHGHETVGADRADAVLERLGRPSAERRRITRLIRTHLRPGLLADSAPTRRALFRIVRELGDDLDLLLLHAAADALGSGASDTPRRWRGLRRVLVALSEAAQQAGRRPRTPLLDGTEVMRTTGYPPGPEIGRILSELIDAQLLGQVATPEEARVWLRKQGVKS